MKRRWYDLDPALSLAVSLMCNSDDETKDYCAKFIIKTLQENNVKINEGFAQVIRKFTRWYDENKDLSIAMDQLKEASDELKKKIALDIIEHLQTVEIK